MRPQTGPPQTTKGRAPSEGYLRENHEELGWSPATWDFSRIRAAERTCALLVQGRADGVSASQSERKAGTVQEHSSELLKTIAIALPAAFVGGMAAKWLRLPVLVGYLLAGVAVGPFTPGLVANSGVALELAEIGVVLLMFGVGLHFSIGDLVAVRRIAVPGALGQIVVATALGVLAGRAAGWSLGEGLVLGLAISVASTVVLLRALEERELLHSEAGRVAIGWLIVEDVFTVVALVVLPTLAPSAAGGGPLDVAGDVGIAVAKAAALTAVMLIAGARFLPWLLTRVEREGSRELFTLAVLAVALGIAFAASEVFGVSFALGAFLAGAVLSSSHLSDRAAAEVLPLSDAFGVLFFVAVGMLLDPGILLDAPLEVAAVLVIVVVAKFLTAIGLVRLLGGSARTGGIVGAGLAQIGEFSFIVATTAVAVGLLSGRGFQLIVAAALLSIALNPLAYGVTTLLDRRGARRPSQR
jgi:K+:H+ antiporter